MQGFTLSSGIGRIPNIQKFLGVECISRNLLLLGGDSCKTIYSWGHKPYSKAATHLARLFSKQHVRLEDGFVCSFGSKGRHRKYSLVIDKDGIYYDASSPSRLENILNDLDGDSWQLNDPAVVAEAQSLMQSLIANDISKYNIAADSGISANDELPFVLVVDQTFGDQSVRYGGMQGSDFADMLQHAVMRHGATEVKLKVHPDVLAGRKTSYLSDLARELGVELICGDIPLQKLGQCKAAYVGTSLYGFELLMRGVSVNCFGQPFYAGWGLTEDRKSIERRNKERTLTEVFIAAYLLYPQYIDPVTGDSSNLAEIIEHVIEQRRQSSRVGGDYHLLGITPWKRKYVNRYMMDGEYQHQYVSLQQLEALPVDAANDPPSVMVWGRAAPSSMSEQMLQRFQVARMEDGFVRSVGLGSNFTAPRSLIVDDLGIYFDASRPSRLEHFLQHRDCTKEEIERAQKLIALLTENRISKYTASDNEGLDKSFYADKQVILVVGQVHGDASLRYGTDKIDSNLKLLQQVRKNNPDAPIVYKPHPDVVSGNRNDGIDSYNEIADLCDHVETNLSIDVTLNLCDQVHTMTSLAGLEALLCGKHVVTYGKPFYAGWGLTDDLCQFERRGRKRSLAELVYICYIVYPGYLDIESGEFTSVEKTIKALVEERSRSSISMTATGLKKYVNIVRNIRKGLTYAA